MRIEIAALSDCGKIRDVNEDSHAVFQPDDPWLLEQKGVLCVVADGLGGHGAGDLASGLAVAALREHYYAPSSGARIEHSLRGAVQAANLRVLDYGHDDPHSRHMQTTLSAVVLSRATAYVAHIGDSRVYLIRENTIRQLTADHSTVGEMTRLGLLSAEEARQHPFRHVVNRTLGAEPLVRPDLQRVPVQPGDTVVLCSDGLWSELEDAEIAAAVARHDAHEACAALCALVLGREATDNLTVIVARVHEVDEVPPPEGRLISFLRRAGLRPSAEDARS